MNIDETDRPEADTLELIHEEIRLTLARQADALAALNMRAQQILGFGGAFIALIVGLQPPRGHALATALFIVGVAVFALVATAGIAAWTLAGWRGGSRPRRLWTLYRLWPLDWLREQLILSLVDAHEANENSLDAKVRYLRLGQVFLGLEVLYLVGIVIARPYL